MEEQKCKRNIVLKNVGLVLWSSILIVITFFGMLFIGVGLEAMGIGNEFWANGIARILAACILLWIFKKRNPKISIGMGKRGWVLGLLLGWPIYIGTIINSWDSIEAIDWIIAIAPSQLDYIGYVVYVLSIGLFEEALLRGVVLNKMRNAWGNTKRGIYASVIVSSLLFGLFHLINLLDKPWLVVATWTQVSYAFIFGFIFAAIYIRTKNLWTVIVFHALFDITGCLEDLFIRQISEKISPDISVMDGIMTLLPFLFLLAIGMFYIRKEKLEVKV